MTVVRFFMNVIKELAKYTNSPILEKIDEYLSDPVPDDPVPPRKIDPVSTTYVYVVDHTHEEFHHKVCLKMHKLRGDTRQALATEDHYAKFVVEKDYSDCECLHQTYPEGHK